MAQTQPINQVAARLTLPLPPAFAPRTSAARLNSLHAGPHLSVFLVNRRTARVAIQPPGAAPRKAKDGIEQDKDEQPVGSPEEQAADGSWATPTCRGLTPAEKPKRAEKTHPNQQGIPAMVYARRPPPAPG